MKLGYARTSSEGQQSGLEIQVEMLEKEGCDRIYSEKLSGKDRNRPQLEEMLRNLRKGDTIISKSIDRVARSMCDLSNISKKIEETGANLKFLDQNIDTSDPTGKLLFNILGSLAEFERSLINSRTKAGRENAKKNGVKFGRKKSTNKNQDAQMILAYQQGQTWKQIAETFDVSRQLVYRRIRNEIAC